MSGPRVLVAVPTRSDEPGLVRTLEDLAGDLVAHPVDGEVRIAVCVNGAPGTTAAMVAALAPLAAGGLAGGAVPLEVHELEVASKPAAWTLLRALPSDVVVFADADVTVRPGSLAALVGELVADPSLVAATADELPDVPRSLAGRVTALPFRLPFAGLAGRLYALRTVTAPTSLPPVLLDDGWLYGSLAAAHGHGAIRRAAGAGACFTLPATWRDVWRQRVRAEHGTRELLRLGLPLAPAPAGRSTLGALRSYPRRDLPLVGLLAALKVAATKAPESYGRAWNQAASTKVAGPRSVAPAGPADVVVVTYNTEPLVRPALAALAEQPRVGRIVVVDNASTDGSADEAAGVPGVEVVRNATNVGFAAAVNQALVRSEAPSVLLLNVDVELGPRYVEALVDALDASPDAASATGLLVLPDGRVDSTGITLTAAAWGSDRDRHADPLSVLGRGDPFGVSGAAGLFRRTDLDAAGGMWEALFVYGEDVELAWRLQRAGRRALFVPAATAVHQRGADSADPTFVEAASYGSRLAMLARHRGLPGLLDPRTLLVTLVVTARLALRHPAALRRAAPMAKVRAGLAARVGGPTAPLSPHPWRAWLRAQVGR